MVAHIAVEAGRYRGAVYAWDVVNEPFNEDGSWRKSIWYEAMGPDYVAIALKAARAADPDARLYVNDYGVETAGPKMRALYDLVASVKRDGVPIDGVGLQSHFVAGETPADLETVMAEFASLGSTSRRRSSTCASDCLRTRGRWRRKPTITPPWFGPAAKSHAASVLPSGACVTDLLQRESAGH